MILAGDADYQYVKGRLRRGEPLAPVFAELAAWVKGRFGVEALDFWYDEPEMAKVPRLEIIVNTLEDETLLTNDEWRMPAARQAEVVKAFAAAVAKHRLTAKYTCEGLFVYTGVFEHVARREANEKVSREEIEALKRTLNDPELWEIMPFGGSVTFFFFTAAQAKQREAAGYLAKYTAAWAKLAATYDEFGVFKRRPVSTGFDSKENFDTNYQGNWYYYFK